jgi:hypothetical protein
VLEPVERDHESVDTYPVSDPQPGQVFGFEAVSGVGRASGEGEQPAVMSEGGT